MKIMVMKSGDNEMIIMILMIIIILIVLKW